jgi:hypothetical protein
MGRSFVTIDGTTGFWMRDPTLELWLRLLALHIPEESSSAGRSIRDKSLLASGVHFNGCVPHDLEDAASTEHGRRIVRAAVESLLTQLRDAPPMLDGGTLSVLGFDGGYGDIETASLMEVGQAFLDLLDGKIRYTAESIEFMPGHRKG